MILSRRYEYPVLPCRACQCLCIKDSLLWGNILARSHIIQSKNVLCTLSLFFYLVFRFKLWHLKNFLIRCHLTFMDESTRVRVLAGLVREAGHVSLLTHKATFISRPLLIWILGAFQTTGILSCSQHLPTHLQSQQCQSSLNFSGRNYRTYRFRIFPLLSWTFVF